MTQVPTTDLLPALSEALADAAARVAPAIVQVFGRKRPASGIVIAPERVLSTSHSVEWEEGVRVRADDASVHDASIVGHDHGADLVVLKVPGLAAPPIGWSDAPPRPGQLVLLTGRSWGGSHQVRLTLVGSIAGPIDTAEGAHLERVIALAASPYPGYSGSALVAADGMLLAMATAGLARGRALALPASAIRSMVEALEAHGTARRGFIGVTSQPVRIPRAQRGTLEQQIGLVVLGVAENSPAEAGGVLVGDILVRADGAPVERAEQLLARLRGAQVGQPLMLSVLRGTVLHDVPIAIGERPARW